MADLYGTNYKAKFVTVPESKIPVGEQAGIVRVAYDKYDLSVLGVTVAVADVIYLQKIPAGARVLDAWVKFPDFGGSGTVDIGWQASLDGVETASSAAIFSALDVKTAADLVLASQAAASPVICGRKFSSEVQVVAVPSEALNAVTGTLELWIQYVID